MTTEDIVKLIEDRRNGWRDRANYGDSTDAPLYTEADLAFFKAGEYDELIAEIQAE